MRKYITGFVAGLLIACAFPVYGAVNSLIGKKVQNEYPVLLEGKRLESNAIVFDGVGYVSVNEIAEATGYFVQFKDNTIIIKKKISKTGEPPLETQPTP